MKTQMMAYIHFVIVMLSVISYNSVFTQLTIEPEMSETCATTYGSEVLQIYHIITHLKDNISALEGQKENMQSQIDEMKVAEEGMQRKIDVMEGKEEGMQRLIDSMEIKEAGMQNLIDAMKIKEEGMQGLIDALKGKEEGMQGLIEAMEVEEEEIQSQVDALETNEILVKTKSEVRDLREQNENLIEQNTNCTIIAGHQQTQIDDFKGNMTSLQQRINQLESFFNNGSNCADLYKLGHREDGVYSFYQGWKLYCDMTQDGGGWTVIQRRFDGSVNFTRNWGAYKTGFGNLTTEFWLGNNITSLLTKYKKFHIHIYLEDFEGNHKFAQYSDFQLGDEKQKYTLHIGNYSGDAGDSLTYHKGRSFSTYDNDNDALSSNCASRHQGGFWFNSCGYAYLNGQYSFTSSGAGYANGLVWYHWKGWSYSLKKTTMKIRPMDY